MVGRFSRRSVAIRGSPICAYASLAPSRRHKFPRKCCARSQSRWTLERYWVSSTHIADMTTVPSGLDADAFRLLVESVVDYAIFVLDVSGRVMTWNRGAQLIKGYAPDEIIGQDFSVFYPPEDVTSNKPQRELERARDVGRIDYEGWRVRKDGTRFWANVTITALRDEAGKLQGFAKVTRDLTERRAAEENAQRLAEERAGRAAAESSASRLRRLQATTAALSRAITPLEVGNAVLAESAG